MSATTTRTAEQYCTFWVAGLFFGVAVDEVQEVLRLQPMTPVPRADRAVTGLINLRGQIVTAVDLRVRLGLPDRDGDELPMNVIVRSRGEVVSLLVDDIGTSSTRPASACSRRRPPCLGACRTSSAAFVLCPNPSCSSSTPTARSM